MKPRRPQSFDFMREHVERSHAEAQQFTRPRRACHECGAPCVLSHGRHSGKWFWSHEHDTDCIFDQIGKRLFFDTSVAAMEAEAMFATTTAETITT